MDRIGEREGVFQTHRNLLHCVRSYANGLRLGPEDRLLVFRRLVAELALREIWRFERPVTS